MSRDAVLETLLGQLSSLIQRRSITSAKLSPDDNIFKIISVNDFETIINTSSIDFKIILLQPIKEITSLTEQISILTHYHNHPLEGGHTGFRRTYEKLKCLYIWPGMSKDIFDFIKNCNSCKINKSKPATKEPMQITPTPNRPFQSIIIDTIGPFPSTVHQSKYAITIICDVSKYLIIVPVPNKEASTVANVILNHCILIFGPIKRLRSDLGTEFANKVIKDLLTLLHISHDTSTPYHHESVGTIERSHKTLNEYLRSYTHDNPKSWHLFCKYFSYCFNTTPNTAINMYTPFELVYGRRATPLLQEESLDSTLDLDEYVNRQKETMKLAHKRTYEFIQKHKNCYKQYYDKKINPISLSIGDNVIVINEIRSKNDPFYKDGYVVEGIDGVNCILRHLASNKTICVHKNKICK